jgi:DNA-binding NarL/FixJ family response regulator
MIRVITVDDHPVVRRGLKQICPETSSRLKKWRDSYPEATFERITPDNYLDFVG